MNSAVKLNFIKLDVQKLHSPNSNRRNYGLNDHSWSTLTLCCLEHIFCPRCCATGAKYSLNRSNVQHNENINTPTPL